jgi:hypothetical protein
MKITLEGIEAETYLNFLANVNQHKCPTLPPPPPPNALLHERGFAGHLTIMREAKRKNSRIPAIKALRTVLGLGLRDAKDIVDALWDWDNG